MWNKPCFRPARPAWMSTAGKCSITQLVEAQSDGHWAWPCCPRREYLQVMGEGDWRGSRRGACKYSCLLRIHPLINRVQPQGVVKPALHQLSLRSRKSGPGDTPVGKVPNLPAARVHPGQVGGPWQLTPQSNTWVLYCKDWKESFAGADRKTDRLVTNAW